MKISPLYLKGTLILAIIAGIHLIGINIAEAAAWEDKPFGERERFIGGLYQRFQDDFYKAVDSPGPRLAVQFVRKLTEDVRTIESKSQKDENLIIDDPAILRAMILDIIQNGTGVGGIDTSRSANTEETDELTQAILTMTFMEVKDEEDLGKKKREQVLARLEKIQVKKEVSSTEENAHKATVRDLVARSYELMNWTFSCPYSEEDLFKDAPLSHDEWNNWDTTRIATLMDPMRRAAAHLNEGSHSVSFGAHKGGLGLLPILSFNKLDGVGAGLQGLDFSTTGDRHISSILDLLRKLPEVRRSWALFHFSSSEYSESIPSLLKDIDSPEKVSKCLGYLSSLNDQKFQFLMSPIVQDLLAKMDPFWKSTGIPACLLDDT